MTAALTEAFARLAEVMPEPLLLVTAGGTLEAANPAAADRLGVARSDLVGRPLHEFLEDGAADIARYLRTCARSALLVPGSATVVRPDGSREAYRCEGTVIEARSGQLPAVILLRLVPKRAAVDQFVALNERIEQLTREVARRRAAEEALREQREWLRVTLASIADAVIATDLAARIIFMNAAAQRHTGWDPADALGRRLDEVFSVVSEGSREPIAGPAVQALQGTSATLADNLLLLGKGGGEIPIDSSASPIRDDRGKVLGVVLVFHDISDRRRMERELGRRAEQLALADRRKDDFLATLAHELRNPLVPLRNGLEILRVSADDPARLGRVREMMERQIAQLTRLVDDLLDVSRITRGKIRLRPELVALAPIMEQAIETARPLMDERGHHLDVRLPPETARVTADQVRLSQVFGNLLVNAAKFTEPGGQIRFEARIDGGDAVVGVRDNGVGIAPEVLPDMFELFTQGDRSLDRSQGGLGVGLMLVKTLVEMHGGSVRAHSDGPGRGSEFSVRIPLAADGAPAMQSAAPRADPGGGTGRRVLVVDDNLDAAESLAILLRHWQHDVRVAHDGPAAVELARRFRPEVVLLDVGLPGMSGHEVVRLLRLDPATTKARVIAVTGYGREEDRQRSEEAGFDQHLTKPVDPEALRALVALQDPPA